MWWCSMFKHSSTCVHENQRWGIFVMTIICLCKRCNLLIIHVYIWNTVCICLTQWKVVKSWKSNISMFHCRGSIDLINCTNNIIIYMYLYLLICFLNETQFVNNIFFLTFSCNLYATIFVSYNFILFSYTNLYFC